MLPAPSSKPSPHFWKSARPSPPGGSRQPKGVLLLQMVPDNGASGAIYVFDRQREQWYMLSFEGCEDQFTSEKFDRAFSEYDLFRLVEQPGLLLSEFQPANA